jgi:hypothetical protein
MIKVGKVPLPKEESPPEAGQRSEIAAATTEERSTSWSWHVEECVRSRADGPDQFDR